jgi:hypothetical protein
MKSRELKRMKTKEINDNPDPDSDKIAEPAPGEELRLRVEQIFEEAEELWRWMHSERG